MLFSDWLVSRSEALVDVGTAQQKTLTGVLVSSSELLSRIEELILFKTICSPPHFVDTLCR